MQLYETKTEINVKKILKVLNVYVLTENLHIFI
nr:MAG TPA: hypothetical protein [Caudoviricetes sp.]